MTSGNSIHAQSRLRWKPPEEPCDEGQAFLLHSSKKNAGLEEDSESHPKICFVLEHTEGPLDTLSPEKP